MSVYSIRGLSPLGWKIIIGISHYTIENNPILFFMLTIDILLVLSFAVASIIGASAFSRLPWWQMQFRGHSCDNSLYMVVNLRYGLCIVPHTAGIDVSNCTRWTDSAKWDSIDTLSGSHTKVGR